MVLDTSWLLIFGGCCSNVFTLEAIVQHEPDSGLLITVSQFILAALFALPTQLQAQTLPWRLRNPSIPVPRLAVVALMFFTVNMLNNWAFAFEISVPMHIILRSFGSVTTMAIGWLVGKSYSRVQVWAVAGLTVGVVVSAWADARAKGAEMSLKPHDLTSPQSTTTFTLGILVLFAAQIVSATMGVLVESTYATYGRHWRENLFYSHFFGCFFSLALLPSLASQLRRLAAGPRATIIPQVLLTKILPTRYGDRFNATLTRTGADAGGWALHHAPESLLYLALNAVTQVICIVGVNQLSAGTTAVTVTVVLNIRKLVSFLLSCWIFGNPVGGLMALGAMIVFASGALYGLDSSRRRAGPKVLTETPSREKGIRENGSADDDGKEVKGKGRARASSKVS